MIKLLKKCHLNITIQTNLKIANFLEVESNLDTDTYQLYKNQIVYLYTSTENQIITLLQSKSFLKQQLNGSRIFHPMKLFLMSQSQYIQMYSEKMFFHDKITFITKITNIKTNKKKSHKRKIFWFNPPYYLSVKTNGKRYS